MNLQMKDPVTGAVPELRQWYFFREALIEKYGIIDEYKIAVDHEQGKCYYGSEEYGIVFPHRVLRYLHPDLMDRNRKFKYCFIGKWTHDREWVSDFNIGRSEIRSTNYGRDIGKDELHLAYLLSMCDSTFALCPKGDHLWTYRFFEACLCGAVPVVRLNEVAEAYRPYQYLIYDGNMSEFYRQADAEDIARIRNHNHQMFLTRNLLPL